MAAMTTEDDTEEELSALDRDALERAIEQYCSGSGWQRKTIDTMFGRGDGWERVGRYAVPSASAEELGLPPWLVPPCKVNDIASDLVRTDDRAERTGVRAAARLRQHMERCGLSRWAADPAAAIAEAEQRQAAK